MRISLACVLFLTLSAGCGDDSSGSNDQAVAHDLATTAGDMAVGADLAGTVTLKLENYLSWCSVSVNGGTANTTAVQNLSFTKGTTVNLMGDKANATFEWGYWVGTVGDTGASHDTTMGTTVVMSADKTVQACCPFAAGAEAHQPCPAP
jgi:hypothetical protein